MKPQGMARRKRALRKNGGAGKESRMKSKVVSLVLAAVIGVASLPTVSRADDDDDNRKAASVADQVAKAMPETPPTEPTTGHKALVYTLKGVEGVEVGLGILEATGPVALGFEIAGPIAAMAVFWIELGGAHQEAINSLIRDEMLSGFSRGVVLGADDRKPDYVKWNFVKHSPVRNVVYPEYGKKFQNAYNQALVAGYAQGRKLLESKAQRSAFFEDLYSRMSVHPSIEFGEDQDAWSERDWINYYGGCAAVLRRDHLE
jgi:hypothetical protein